MTTNAAQPAYGGGRSDAFVTKIDPIAGQPVFSTYLGGDNGNDGGHAIATDLAGKVYVVGHDAADRFPDG